MKKIIFISLLFTQFSAFSQIDPNKLSTSIKFDEVISNIERFYVDPVDSKKLTETAIIALLEQLDPHSTYIPAEDADEAQSQINGSFVGIGVRFQIVKDTLMVVEAIPGGPSEKIGVLAGDKIVLVDQLNIAGIGLKNNEVRSKLMGELGTKVTIGILRKNVPKQLDFTIVRDKIPIHSVDAHYMLTPEIGYIKLSIFSRTTVEEVQESIKELKKAGMKQLIFDLQGNGGGLLDAAHRLADEFLSEDKLIVYSEGRTQPRSNLRAGKKGLWEKGDLIILTDEYAASASEILSGALQDWDRALIVGRRTFGKGLVQRPIQLADGGEIRITIARYFTPTGRFIQKPYDDTESYKKDLTQRYLNGEFQNADSIKFPDSLKFLTLKTKRTVYGGGGIMPDVFVPLDTLEITDYFGDLVRGGHVNTFIFSYVNKNRESLRKTYPNFSSFQKNFKIDDAFMKSFFDYVAQEDSTLIYNDKEYQQSKFLLQNRMTSNLAQDLWGANESFQIYNATNEVLQKAISVLKSNTYTTFNLEK
jgi:carboxyl-terminal processing protease